MKPRNGRAKARGAEKSNDEADKDQTDAEQVPRNQGEVREGLHLSRGDA
jgi:hypothetical protein